MNKLDRQTQLTNNAHAIIGVKSGASEEELRIAFIKLAKIHHPDLNKNDQNSTNKFIEILRAYEILKQNTRQQFQESRSSPDFFREAAPRRRRHFNHVRRRARWNRIFWQCLITITILLGSLATLLIIIWANTKTDWIPNCC